MGRPIQPWVMILGCAALVVAAVLLPALLLRSPRQVEPVIQIPIRPPPVARAPDTQAPVAQAPKIQAPVTQAPVTQAPAVQAPATQAPDQSPLTASIDEGDGLSRAERFAIMERETLKELGPEGALGAVLPPRFPFPHSREDAIFGIDVSHHNTTNCRCEINWDRVASQKVAFVYAKASEGVRFRDPKFAKHWLALAPNKKIHRGAYHFMSADDDPEEQANYFLATIGALQAGDLPPALDLEWDVAVRSTRKWVKRDDDYWSNVSPDDIIERALKWLSVVEERTGRPPIIYTSRTWWMQRVKDESKLARLKRYPIWISAMENADLQVEKPGAKGRWAGKWHWTIWQFTDKGDLTKAGVPAPGGFDVNIFPGTLAEFQQALGIAASIEGPGTGIVIAQPKEPPKDAQTGGAERADSGATPPIEPPNDQQAGTPPPDGGTVEPIEPPKDQTAGTPTPGGEAVSPQEPQKQQVAALPGADNSSGKPGSSGSGKIPESGTKAPAGARLQINAIEIVLRNGRIIRTDANIDPDVLSRLIAVLERQ